MGTWETRDTSAADALFTRGQQRVLGILFSDPERSFAVTELIARAGVGTGAVHRELARLTRSGIVSVTPLGRQRRYSANARSPIFPELRSLVLKTVVFVEPLRQALASLGTCIRAAFVYGPMVEGTATAGGDINLMIIAEGVSDAELLDALEEAAKVIGRPIDPVLFGAGEWDRRMAGERQFAERVDAISKIFVLGTESDLV